MKNFLLPVLGLLFFCPLFAQQTVPQGINYQAVLRNGNDILENKPAEVTFTILNGSSTGTLVFQEKYDTSSNSLGQLILVIGQGTHTGGVPFADIDWSQGPKYLKIEATVDGITTVLGTPQIQSVPYALAANPVGTAGGDLSGQFPNPNVARLQGNPVSSTPPAPGLVLKWNGSEWAPASDIDTGDNWGTQVAQSAAPLTGNGNSTPLTIQNESITSQFIQNGAIQTIDVADGAITAAKLNNMGASPGQVLQWNGTAWAPTNNTTGDNWGTQVAQVTAPLTGNGSTTPLALLPESITSQFIQNGTIQTIDVADGAITAVKLNNMGANPGQVLKWNGTAWAPTMDEIGTPGSDNSAENEGKLSVQSGTATSSIISSNTANSTNVTLQINGLGLDVSESVGTNTITLSNTGDTNPNDDLKTGDPAGGDLAGTYPNPTIAANAIGAAEIINGSITAADIAAGVIPTSLPPNGPATGDLTGNYPNPDIAPNAVGSNEIANSSITAADIAAGVIPTSLPPSGPASGDLTGNYPNPDIAPNAVGSSEISNGSITAADIATGVIPTSLPPNGPASGDLTGSYPSPDIAPNAVGSNEIANGSITAADIAAGVIPTYTAGSGITISVGNQISATDNSTTNELQILGFNTNTNVLSLTPSGGSVTLPSGGNGFLPCGQAVPVNVGVGTCPDASTRLVISNNENDDKNGINVSLSGGGLNRGMNMEVLNGSAVNDGIIILARQANTTSRAGVFEATDSPNNYALDILAGADNETNGQNVGIVVSAQDRANNPGFPDFAIFAGVENTAEDWAGYFIGDLGTSQGVYASDALLDNALYIFNQNGNNWRLDALANNTLGLFYNNSQVGTFAINGNYTGSDRRLKENIQPLSRLLPKVLELNTVSYNYIQDPNKASTLGFIAQDVEKVFPELTLLAKDDKGNDKLMLNYDGFSVIAIKAIQEQQVIIEAQQTKLESQEARLSSLEKEMAELRALVKSATAEKTDKGSKK